MFLAEAASNGAGAGAALGFLAVLSILSLVSFVFWVWTLVDAIKRDDAQWTAAGQNKTLWIVLIVLLGVIGSVAYLLVPRPALKRV